MSIRVVLDTNCIISALLFSRKNLLWLRHAWQTGLITPVICKVTASELIAVLNYPKFKLTKEEQHTLLAEILPHTETVNTFIKPAHLPVIRDEKDQVFLDFAVACNADALVSGDQDLLAIKETFILLPIMSLSEFESWVKNNSSSS